MTGFRPVFSMVYSKDHAGLVYGKVAQKWTKDHATWLLLRPGFVPSWCGASGTIRGILENREVFRVLLRLLPRDPLQRKGGCEKKEKWNAYSRNPPIFITTTLDMLVIKVISF